MAILQIGLLTRTKTTVSYEPEDHAIVLMGEDVKDVKGRRAGIENHAFELKNPAVRAARLRLEHLNAHGAHHHRNDDSDNRSADRADEQ